MEKSKGALHFISKITYKVLEQSKKGCKAQESIQQIPSINNQHAPHTSDEWLPTKEHDPESPACPLLIENQDAGSQGNQKCSSTNTYYTANV